MYRTTVINNKKNIKNNFMLNENKEKKKRNLDLNPDIIMNNLKLIQKNKCGRNETNHYSHNKYCKNI